MLLEEKNNDWETVSSSGKTNFKYTFTLDK